MYGRSLAQALDLVSTKASGNWRKERSDKGNSTVIPALIIAGVNAKVLWDAHWSHWEHMPPLEERTEYSYQNIRTRNYFWGDGDKVGTLPLKNMSLANISVDLLVS